MGRPVGELNAERAAIREDPTVIHERFQQAVMISHLTEHREPPKSLAEAYRIATIDPECPKEVAQTKARNLKTWARRYFGGSLATTMLVYGLGRDDFMEQLSEMLSAVKRDAKGRIRKDPDTGEPIPDTAVRFRAMRIWERLLMLSGQFGAVVQPDGEVRQELYEAAERAREIKAGGGKLTPVARELLESVDRHAADDIDLPVEAESNVIEG